MKQQLIVIEGPTASGKTALGVELAKRLGTVVISADSRQFYKELAIGTAKPTPGEMQEIEHYFVDSHSITDPVTAARFEQEALQLIQRELGHLPEIILVGGSGMFIDALCIGLDPIPADALIQETLRRELQSEGLEKLCEELKNSDEVYYNEVDLQNSVRVLRALEVIRLTGKPFSAWRQQKPAPRPFDVKRFVIEHPREQLYDRINRRVDQMLNNGLLEEARTVHALQHLSTLQTVGYKECFDYFEGVYTYQECVDKIKQHTRNYAKRQLTWFQKHPDSVWIPFNEVAIMSDAIQAQLNRC